MREVNRERECYNPGSGRGMQKGNQDNQTKQAVGPGKSHHGTTRSYPARK